MKKLFIVIALLVAVTLVAPQFIGNIVETEHQSGIDKLNENPAITINSTSFQHRFKPRPTSVTLSGCCDKGAQSAYFHPVPQTANRRVRGNMEYILISYI